MNLEKWMHQPVEVRRQAIEHQAGMDHEGRRCCLRCGLSFADVPLLYWLPVYQTVWTYKTQLVLERDGPVPDATPCTPRKEHTWNAQF